jgi:pimeloyl-ACP methyl ester carboxylesterase/DNA-binding CsgD family transcriptional regulator
MSPATDWKPRDLEILRLLGEGLSDRAIAERLRLKPETIRWYNKRIFERLGVSSRIQAVRTAIAKGVLSTAVATAPVPPVARSPIKYLMRDGPSIAYQVVGSGPVDLVFVQSFISNLEVEWDEPECAAFFERLARGARLFLFDRRGVGLSDRTDRPTAMHETVEDIRAMLAAEGSTRAFVLGSSEGGAVSVLLASMYPDLVQGLILFGATAKATRDGDEPAWARDRASFLDRVERIVASWGGPWAVAEYAPSRADDARFRDWWARMLRASSSPTAIRRVLQAVSETDVRALLPHVGVRTLVVHRAGDRLVPEAAGRYLAARCTTRRTSNCPARITCCSSTASGW